MRGRGVIDERRTTRVLIADDHEAIRQSLRAVLLAEAGLEIVAEASTGDDAVKLAKAHQPEIAILDVRMPGLNGIAAGVQILNYSPRTTVFMLSLSSDEQHVASALLAGIQGYIAKEDTPECLPAAIEASRAGKFFLSPAAARALARSSMLTISPELERELLVIVDEHALALFQGALVAGADEASARDILRESLMAYSLARFHPEPIRNIRAWLLIAVTTLVFERCPIAPAAAKRHTGPLKERVAGMGANLAGWWRRRFQPHPDLAEFEAYWSGAAPDYSSSGLIEHVRGCRWCHMEWSLMATSDRVQHEMERAAGCDIGSLRNQLIDDLRISDISLRAGCLRQYRRRISELIASELDLFFGEAAAARWKGSGTPEEGGFSAPLPLFVHFLGGRIPSLPSTMLPGPAFSPR